MYIIVLRGGLGNQMFQYAAGYVLQRKEKVNVQFSKFYLQREPNAQTHVDSLDNLNIQNLKVLPRLIDYPLSYWMKLKYKMLCKFKLGGKNPNSNKEIEWMKSKGIINIKDVYRYVDMTSNKMLTYVDCFFQNIQYLKGYEDELRKALQLSKEYIPDEKNANMLRIILETESVCIHVRRGDYTASQWAKSLLVCDKTYYETAIKLISEKKPNANFFVFSNSHEDLCWIKDNYDFPENAIYVDLANTDYQELFLMMHCKSFVLSNSSFSWWAQFLSDDTEKIVVAPSKWCNDADASGIYQKDWLVVKTEGASK